MRELNTAMLTDTIAGLCVKACTELPDDTVAALRAALTREESPYGKRVLLELLENARVAKDERMPACQDTGTTVVFMEIGQEVCWTGNPLQEAINEGVARGYSEGFLRKSIAADPFERENTGDNTPAIVHYDSVAGDKVKITVLPKGGGCENMSCYMNLLPSDGKAGVLSFVVDAVKKAGGKPCPPLFLGVGIGGTMEACCLLAKKAVLRPYGARNQNSGYAALETELLEKVNALGIGPGGLGGRITALDAHIEARPCHITSLPVALCFQCHSNRRAEAVL
jgi:fumarate hydratase subunit alpha